MLALPRGGVPVAQEVARSIAAPLDACVVRKLGLPGREHVVMGAIAKGVLVIDGYMLDSQGISDRLLEAVLRREERELDRGEALFRDGAPSPHIADRIVILVDDGLVGGSTMRAAAAAVREQRPKRLVVAVPIATAAACYDLSGEVDEICCARPPQQFEAVAPSYRDYARVTDDEVRAILRDARVASAA